jgi:hypothetical protein
VILFFLLALGLLRILGLTISEFAEQYPEQVKSCLRPRLPVAIVARCCLRLPCSKGLICIFPGGFYNKEVFPEDDFDARFAKLREIRGRTDRQ